MNKILVPTDFSELSGYALEVALQIAEREKIEVQLLHVINLPDGWKDQKARGSDLTVTEQAEKEFDSLLERIDNSTNVKINTELRFGPIYDTITARADEMDASLIVMGTYGKRGVNRFFAGSNTQKIVRLSNRPVLSVKSKVKQFNLTNVVFAAHFFGEVQNSFDSIKALAQLYGAKVHLLKVITPSSFENTSYSEKLMSEFAEKNQLENFTMNTYNHKDLGRGIVEFSNKVNAELIAINTHGRRGISHLLSGSLAEDLVNETEACIMSVKLPKEPKNDNILFPE